MASAVDPATITTFTKQLDRLITQQTLILAQITTINGRLDSHDQRLARLEIKMSLPPLQPTLPAIDSSSMKLHVASPLPVPRPALPSRSDPICLEEHKSTLPLIAALHDELHSSPRQEQVVVKLPAPHTKASIIVATVPPSLIYTIIPATSPILRLEQINSQQTLLFKMAATSILKLMFRVSSVDWRQIVSMDNWFAWDPGGSQLGGHRRLHDRPSWTWMPLQLVDELLERRDGMIWKDMLWILWAQDLLSQVRKAIKNKGVCYPLRISYLGLNPFVTKEINLLAKIKGP
jgi:hypothetical protein